MTHLGSRFLKVLLLWFALTFNLVHATATNVSPRSQPGVELLRMDIEWINSPQSPLPSRSGVGTLSLPSGVKEANPDLAQPGHWRPAQSGLSSVKEANPDLAQSGTETKSEWQINPSDRRLSIVLQRWSAQANWQLVWEAERDFPVEVRVVLEGSFTDALKEVMKSLSDTDYPLQAVMNAKTRVLRVRHRSGGGL